MSFKEIESSIKSVFDERIKSPFYGTFIFSWAICNWKIIYLTLFVNQDLLVPETKVSYIIKNYSNWEYLLLFPFLSAVFLVTLAPWFSNKLYKVALFYERERVQEKEKIDSKRRLTIEETAIIRNEIQVQQENNIKQLNSKDNELQILRQQVTNYSDQIGSLESRFETLKKEENRFKILFAQYGRFNKQKDVTDRIYTLFSISKEFEVNNINMDGDPFEGQLKELLVIFSINHKISSLIVKEHFSLKLEGEQLVVEETETSKRVYSAINISFSELFPGRWKVQNAKDEEIFEIRDGDMYFSKSMDDKDLTHKFNITGFNFDADRKAFSFDKDDINQVLPLYPIELKIIKDKVLYAGIGLIDIEPIVFIRVH